jgi:AcrR family transcriptional regulator
MPRTRTAKKQEAILEAASRVFSDREFHQVLCDDIAARARVGKGTLYRYFANKEDLYFATITDGFSKLYGVLAARVAEEATCRGRLERLAREILAFFWHRRDFYTLLYRNDRRFLGHEGVLRRTRERIVGLIREILVEGIERGEFRRVDPRIASELFSGMIRAVNIFRRDDDTPDFLVAQLMGVFLAGIASETSR